MEDAVRTEKTASEDKAKRYRSPQFPFIPLDKAVTRAREFEAEYHQHSPRQASAVKTWGYAGKSSGGIQTVAALVAYGLMEDEGTLDNRRVKLTPAAMTILKDTRPGAAASALKVAALKPPVLAELWRDWGVERPPDHACISTLHLDKKFSEEAAARLLAIYEATIRYAGLAPSDKIADNQNGLEDAVPKLGADKEQASGKRHESVPPVPPPSRGKVPLMPDERIIFSHEPNPDQGVRILVTGQMDAAMADVLKKFAEFQVSIAPKTAAAPPKEDPDAKTGE